MQTVRACLAAPIAFAAWVVAGIGYVLIYLSGVLIRLAEVTDGQPQRRWWAIDQ